MPANNTDQTIIVEQQTETQLITLLGSTGSVGVSTLEIIAAHDELYKVFALTANTNFQTMFVQCQRFKPQIAVMVDESSAEALREMLLKSKDNALASIEVLSGEAALERVAMDTQVDAVMAAIVGAAGLKSSMAAASAGKRVLLANKESLVMSGELFMDTVRQNNSELLPIDSEHNAIFQCLPISFDGSPEIHAKSRRQVRKVILTASGGPFLDRDAQTFSRITPDEACNHPKWDMGRKISVDSATLMNKGLEVIEACLLFDLKPEQVEVVIHPQSIIHSMVEYIDGSIVAQMANPDMKIPIAYGLAWPNRIESGVEFLDLVKVGSLDFLEPNGEKFPCLNLAYKALSIGGFAPAVLNAANELAVDAFLGNKISFTDIPLVIDKVIDDLGMSKIVINPEQLDLESVLNVDMLARENAQLVIDALSAKRCES